MPAPVLSFWDALSGGSLLPTPLDFGASLAAGTPGTRINVYIAHTGLQPITNVGFYLDVSTSYGGAATAAADLAELKAGAWLQLNQNFVSDAWVNFDSTNGTPSNLRALTTGASPGSTINNGARARIQLRINPPISIATTGRRDFGVYTGFSYTS